jgi:hypothetical protein
MYQQSLSQQSLLTLEQVFKTVHVQWLDNQRLLHQQQVSEQQLEH